VSRATTHGFENDGRGLVRDDHDTFTGNPTGLTQRLQEIKKTVAVEFLRFPAKHKASTAEKVLVGALVSAALLGGGGIGLFWHSRNRVHQCNRRAALRYLMVRFPIAAPHESRRRNPWLRVDVAFGR